MFEFIIANWGWIALGWLLLSIPSGIAIGRHFAARDKAEGVPVQPLYPELERAKQEQEIRLDDPDWKDQIEKLYRDEGGEG